MTFGKNKDDNFDYRKGYIDGLASGKREAFKDLIQLIDGGFASDLEDLKQKLTQRIENNDLL